MGICRKIYRSLLMAAISVAALGCSPDWETDMEPGSGQISDNPDRTVSQDRRKVMLLYIAGYNNLKDYLEKNIQDLMQGWLPGNNRANDVLLVYSHLSKSRADFKTPVEPVLMRIYRDNAGNAVTDTIRTYSPAAISASAPHLHEVLDFVRIEFPAQSYGLVFSSHATGYLPAGFYSNPHKYVFSEGKSYRQGRRQHVPAGIPYIEIERDPSLPEVKSIGQTVQDGLSYEMDIRDFAEAIPMKLDYILFDACLMGGVEVAYELADKCDRLAFSQAEVLAQGFNYTTITTHLLNNSEASYPDLVCEDYFNYYNTQSGSYRSATVSLIDCSKTAGLADLCKELFDRYRTGIYGLDPSDVQRYYTSNHHWFYDLESILINAGASDEDLERLRDCLDDCILYKGCTPSFLGSFDIYTFSGLSMYLPSNGHTELDKYYRTLKWNQATGLVK